jgi:hypothetical protein
MIIRAEVVWQVSVTLDVEPTNINAVRDKIILAACQGFVETTPQITKCDEIPDVVSV